VFVNYFLITFLWSSVYPVIVDTKSIDKREIGRRLRERRELLKMTQQNVADALHVNRITYAQWESGRNEMAVTDLPRLAKLFKVQPSYFFEDLDTYSEEADHDDVMMYYNGMPPILRAAAKASLRAMYDLQDKEDAVTTVGKKAE
jgi:transcriptional regulator with XRE-family HTH domain